MKLYYSIHGSPAEGWSLMVYKYIPDVHNSAYETITPYRLRKTHHDTLGALLEELADLEEAE